MIYIQILSGKACCRSQQISMIFLQNFSVNFESVSNLLSNLRPEMVLKGLTKKIELLIKKNVYLTFLYIITYLFLSLNYLFI